MAIKKSELYSSIWASCDALRGGMDASQYKDYVLVLLFVKYVSDKYAGRKNSVIDVPVGGSFADMVALKGNKDIGDGMNKIIGKLADANDLKGVIDVADFNDDDRLGRGQEMQDRLTSLVGIFQDSDLDFTKNRAEGDDLLGDAYEYLMRNFATESGKSKGQFYTPAEVSRVMAKVIGISAATTANQTIYDPTCGSGSLLLKAADEAGTQISIYGQEMDNSTAALARMNMILHDNPTAEIWKDNSLSSPHWKENGGRLKAFDFVVANPPFSNKAWTTGVNTDNDPYERFKFANDDGKDLTLVPPEKNGDYAFLLHILHSMKSAGKGAIILPHGVLFRGNAEAEIRKKIVRKGYIKGIIGLPANLFYGTGIPACIIVLDKEEAATRTGIFMINASQGYMKDGNKNRLRHQDIHKIVDVFTSQREIPKYSRMVSIDEIASEQNDYNLNIPRYIDNSEEEDLQDIEAHLLGGIPNRDLDRLGRYWTIFPSLREQLFEPADREGYSQMMVAPNQVKSTIYSHPEFQAFNHTISVLFDRWVAQNWSLLEGLEVGSHPKALIEALSESLLDIFAKAPLIDPYDVYQRLMTYWIETMQDDVYLIASDGWQGANQLREIIEDKDAKNKEKPDFVFGKRKYKSDLIPPSLIVARYYSEQQRVLDSLRADQETMVAQMEEMIEVHGGEDGLLEEVINDKGKVTKGAITGRLKAIRGDADSFDEAEVLNAYMSLIKQETELSSKIKEAQTSLDAEAATAYSQITEAEIRVLMLNDKWHVAIAAEVQAELSHISQVLTGRIKELADRYATPLPQLEHDVDILTGKLSAHLNKMGFVWH